MFTENLIIKTRKNSIAKYMPLKCLQIETQVQIGEISDYLKVAQYGKKNDS